MTTAAKILLDSYSPDSRFRLTTFEVTFPRIVLAEFNTHRVFSRNSSSSRAIPVEKMIARAKESPYIPSHWGQNQKGMQAEQEVSRSQSVSATLAWLQARNLAVDSAQALLDLGIHKQITNRLLEPFLFHTVIVTATEWDNFFHLRDNSQAHPDIEKVAHLMRVAYEGSKPQSLELGEWHTPLIRPDDHGMNQDDRRKVSVGRCARVSYLTHDGFRDTAADIQLCDRLLASGHLSPFEHVATPQSWPGKWCGNFRGWTQYRKLIMGEFDILAAKKRCTPDEIREP